MPTGPAPSEALQPLLDLVRGLPKSRPQPSLKPFEKLLVERAATPWWRSLDALKITGSNGKGSVATLAASILSACDVRTGLTTSPHIGFFNERMAVDGVPLPEASLLAAGESLPRHLARLTADGDEVLTFEATTFLAVEALARAGVETLVAEAGIGGRDDATRLLPGRTHALVSVDAEHLGLLGGNLRQVALNKARLAEPGGTLLLGELPTDLEAMVVEASRRRGVSAVPLRPGVDVEHGSLDGREMVFDLTVDGMTWRGLRSRLLGRHQAINCGLAIRLARHWLLRNRPELAQGDGFEERVRQAVARVRLPGRLQCLQDDPPLWIDTAHTPAAMEGLAQAVPRVLGAPWVWVAGVSSDKSADGVLAPLLSPRCAGLVQVVATRAAHRGGDPARVARVLAAQAPQVPCQVEPTLPQALDVAMGLARKLDGSVLVAGGLFLASETLRHLGPSEGATPFY